VHHEERDKTQIEENLDLPLESLGLDGEPAEPAVGSADPLEPAEAAEPAEPAESAEPVDAATAEAEASAEGRASQSPDDRVTGSAASAEAPWLPCES